MSLAFAQIIRLFSLGGIALYITKLGLVATSYPFWVLLISIMAYHLLGQFIGFVSRINSEQRALENAIWLAKNYKKEAKEKQLEEISRN